ncbi:hypothetical protein [Marinicella rhabdoformis]|uniref:hypothetical protein n=1 Tax=Marinicella rhabdoformis TaxID=2580566 RepID=UPI0012AEB4E7|nr:hypothetical protein [Marinicella rhabdoformis]
MKYLIFSFLSVLAMTSSSVAVTYQGELSQSGNPFTGQADLSFSLYDSESGGNQVGMVDLHTEVEIMNGRFVVELDQWSGLFDGTDYWLELSAAVPANSASFITLSPRQKLSPAPYAEFAYDLDVTGLQMRVDGNCNAGSAIQVIDLNGGVICGEFAAAVHGHDFSELVNVPNGLSDGDDDTTYDGSDFVTSNQSCAVGQMVSGISPNGLITCTSVPVVPTPPECNQENHVLQYSTLSGWTCIDISTIGPTGGQAQGFEVTDSWGNAWDGVERAAKPWLEASQICLAAGGRLPTITELYRVSGDYKSELGSSYETNFLWSQTWWDKTNKARVRLTDGAVNNALTTNNNPYRCIWPSPSMSYFAGNHCMGEPGDGCWNHAGYSSNKVSMDKVERPAVSYVAATDECAFVNAHLADQQDFAENIINGLPNGSNSWQWTSDHVRYDINSVVRWQDVDTTFDESNSSYVSWAGRSSSTNKFRCVGVNEAIGPYPITLANEFIAPTTQVKAVDVTSASATYADSIDVCFNQGGHMAHSRDFMELVRTGLSNGPGPAGYAWTSDYSDADKTQVARWTSVDTEYTGYYSEYVTWAANNAATENQHRCVFYPIDSQYVHPPASSCNPSGLGCQTVENGASKIAVDLLSRAPASYLDATQTCMNLGGRLPNALQMNELMRAEEVSFPSPWLWTSDSVSSTGTSRGVIIRMMNDIASIETSVSNKDSLTQRAFHCVWNNELR